jgi:hypothetical protein
MTDGEPDLEDWIRDRFAFLADHGFAVDRVTQLDLSFARESGPSGRKSFWLHQALQVVAPEAWPSGRHSSANTPGSGWTSWRAALSAAGAHAFVGEGAQTDDETVLLGRVVPARRGVLPEATGRQEPAGAVAAEALIEVQQRPDGPGLVADAISHAAVSLDRHSLSSSVPSSRSVICRASRPIAPANSVRSEPVMSSALPCRSLSYRADPEST